MKRVFLVPLIVFSIFLVTPFLVYAEGEDTLSSVDNEIQELKRKITESQSQQKTLSAEISSMDATITLTSLQIKETEAKIKSLGEEIDKLTDKIDRLEITLSHLSELLLNRIVTSYKVNRVSVLPLLFSANGLTDLLSRAKYIQIAQEHDRQVMTDVQITKVNYAEQKDLRETKKQEQEDLVVQLEAQKVKLDTQKKSKEALLAQTKSDETTYQKLLQQALAEKQAIEAALVNGTQVGPVKKGDPIALVGNTGYPGCSTGAHLHFEVRKDNQWVNPASYLHSRSIKEMDPDGSTHDTSLGNGDWDWPLEGEVIMSQNYGYTPYSWRYAYSGGIHTGIDMYSNSSSVIRVPKDGILYSATSDCGSSVIKIKYIEHGDGIVSFYLHVQ